MKTFNVPLKFLFVGLVASSIIASIAIHFQLEWVNLATSFMGIFSFLVPIVGAIIWIIKRLFGSSSTVDEAVRWLASEKNVVRSNHSLVLTLTLEDIDGASHIKIKGVHKFTVSCPGVNESVRYPTEDIYTDLGIFGSIESGGFTYVKIEGEQIFTGQNLVGKLKTDKREAKVQFQHSVTIPSRGKKSFEFHTYGIYRTKDRLVWTVQDLSEAFDVMIINETGISDNENLSFWINHHEGKNIRREMRVDALGHIPIKFTEPVFPYQGFEMFWNFHKKP